MRPMFVFLVSKMFGKGKINEASWCSCDRIDSHSYIGHDDVVDDSYKRRGFFQSMHYGKIRLLF